MLATTGTVDLLEQVSPFIPDDLVNELLPAHRGRGRRSLWSSAQLYRILLLSLLSPAHSYNLLLALLPEQRDWRRFARLRNSRCLPGASQLHEFRQSLGVGGLRRINEYLLTKLIEELPSDRVMVSLIDATDLPAATSSFKKRLLATIRHPERRWVAER